VLTSGSLRNHIPEQSNSDQSADVAQLLAGLGSGDAAAWSAVVRRYGRLLMYICRQHRLTPEQTDDVVQNTWTVLFTHAAQIQNADGLGGWLVTTTRRDCLALRRRESHEVPTDDCGNDWQDTTVDIDVDDRLDAVPRSHRLRRAVATLPPRERSLMEILLEPELPSYIEISRRLQMPIGAIGPVRQRALRRLRIQLDLTGSQRAEISA